MGHFSPQRSFALIVRMLTMLLVKLMIIERSKFLLPGFIVGWIGSEEENGGWKPHVHFQLSVKEPSTHDMPGVVSAEEREQAIQDYPHPFHVTGQLY